MGWALLLIIVGLAMWIAAAHVDKIASLENGSFYPMLMLIIVGIGCVVAGVILVIAVWIEGNHG
jgi:uncharacterized membrane protein YidH (DUF202 family)